MTEYEDEIRNITDIIDDPKEGDKIKPSNWSGHEYILFTHKMWRYIYHHKERAKMLIYYNKYCWAHDLTLGNKVKSYEIL